MDAILAGVLRAAAVSILLCFTIIDAPGLPRAIKVIMPNAIICYRLVYGAHDPSPFETGQTGEQWVANRWGQMQNPYVDFWILTNEWLDNRQPAGVVQRFTDWYCEVVEACREQRVKCTVGDFSAGTPGWPHAEYESHYYPILKKLFALAERYGFPVGWHCYDLLDNWGQRMPREVSVVRFREYIKEFPRLVVIGTEGGNATKDGTPDDGMFRRDDQLPTPSKQYIQTFCDLVWGDLQLVSINWWEITNPALHTQNAEARWDLDNWASVLPWFFDWAIERWARR